VPVGEDQVAHVELTREVARRFNHLYGRDPGFEKKAEEAIKKIGKKAGKLYRELRTAFLEQGDHEALEKARELLGQQQNISLGDQERLFGYLEGGGKIILPEPQSMLTPAPKMPGLDGQKMSKSYNNTIALRDKPEDIEKALRTMPTDTQRVRRTDPGDPARCPVWPLHEVYSSEDTRNWVQEGCKTAGIGCIECKQPVIDAVLAELKPIQQRAKDLSEDPMLIRNIISEGCRKAEEIAEETMEEVREAMGLEYQ
jgi:tryptophanyl-tRNA synthetase